MLALGASFAALEVVPLAYLGFETYRNWRIGLVATALAVFLYSVSVAMTRPASAAAPSSDRQRRI